MRLESLFPLVLPEVSGCPHPTLMLHIAMSAQKFCVETGAWAAMADEQVTAKGVSEYDVEPVSGAMVVRVRDVWLDGQLLPPVKAISAFGREGAAVFGYTHYDDRQMLRLAGTPRAGQKLVMRVVAAPTTTSATLPDALALRYQTAIAHGAKSSLMAMPKQAWSNPQLCAYHAQWFEHAIQDARIDAIKDGVDTPLAVKKRRFA